MLIIFLFLLIAGPPFIPISENYQESD